MATRDEIRERLKGATLGAAGSAAREAIRDKMRAVPEPDPLADVEYTGDLQADSAAELDAIQQGFRDRISRENERFVAATDSEFWVAACFRTRDDKERFLARAGLLRLGDKYLDGHQVAEQLNIDMKE